MVENEYAKAVFELAKEEDKVLVFDECFKAVIETLTLEFLEIINSLFIAKDETKKMLDKVYKSLDTTFIHFLYVLVDHNRFGKIKEIYKEYDKLVQLENNVLKVELISASTLTKAKLDSFKKNLSEKYPGKEILITNTINPNLIGGVIIKTDEKSMDASVLGTLNKIRESL